MKIRVVTPTHIGSGGVITKLDYIVMNGKVRVIDYYKAWEMDKRIREKIERGIFDPRECKNYYKYEIDAFCNPRRDIHEHIKVSGKPYIPGSSLKGAIRTALIWKYLKDRGMKVKSSDELKKVEAVFNNIMRFLVIRDSESVDFNNLGVYEIAILSEKGDSLVEKEFKLYVESLKPNTELEVEIITRDKDAKILKDKNAEILKDWKNTLLEFSKYVLKIDKEFIERRNDGRFDELIKSLEYIEDKLESGRILFRLGFSTGWLWKTVGSLLSRDERIEVAKKLGLSRRFGTDFPKTRRVVVFKGYKWLPGWLEII